MRALRPLTEGLDFYKLTMGQLAWERHPDAEVTFAVRNRDPSRPFTEHVRPQALQERLDTIADRGVGPEEVAYLAGLRASDGSPRFGASYLDRLAALELPPVAVGVDALTGDLTVTASGPWPSVTLWETVVLSELNEAYYEGWRRTEGIALADLEAEGDHRLSAKIAVLRERPDILFSDFGTRRRFSGDWHEHVVRRLADELPDSFLGTSNPGLARTVDVPPVGTFAHEMPMVYAALEELRGGDPLDGHARMLADWYARYGPDLSIALTDTFGSEFFLADFSPEQARSWQGVRHDSGDAVAFGERLIDAYSSYGVDPAEKTVVFSDGLDLPRIVELADRFAGRIRTVFGWGTDLTNDLGPRASNVVMKATAVNGWPTVKLSDAVGKHLGPAERVDAYRGAVRRRLAAPPVTVG